MGIASSLMVFAVGAILRFAVTANTTGFNIRTVGDILMIAAAVGFVLSIIFWTTWGSYGTGWTSRRTTVTGPGTINDPLHDAYHHTGRTVVTQTETRADQDNLV
jgi:hypothetical protein